MKLIDAVHGYVFTAAGGVVFRVNSDDSVDTIRHEKSADSNVVSMTTSTDGSFLFVAYSNKVVGCWDLKTLEVLGTATLRKQPTAIQYGSFAGNALDRKGDASKILQVLLASDKAGEVVALDAPGLKKQALIAGHTASVITDMAIHTSTTTGKTIVATSDRDEKIRISHFPDMENISAFCMAHTKVVASVSFIELNGKVLMLTTGWDHKLILWETNTGTPLQTISFLTTEETNSSTAVVEEKSAESKEEQEGGEEEEVVEEGVLDTTEGGDGEEDLEGKVYDEISAGNYPYKVISTPITTKEALVAVVFKGKALVKMFSLHTTDVGFELTELVGATVSLPALPVDVCFTASNEVAALLPKPYGMQVHRITTTTTTASAVDITSEKTCVAKLLTALEGEGKY